MTAAERAVWEDAEGSFDFYSNRSVYMIRTSQAEKGILEDYLIGAINDGVACRMHVEQRRQTPHFEYKLTMYYTEISGIRNVVREILLTNPWRRHQGKLKQIEKLREILATPAKQKEKKMREAALILRDL